MQRLVPVKDAVVSCQCESFVGNGGFEDWTSSDPPIALPIAPFPSVVLGNAKHFQSISPRFWQFPLLPNIHPETAAQPFIPTFHRVSHTRNVEVAKLSANEDFYLVYDHADVSALTAGSQFFEFLLCFLQGLRMGTDEHAILPLPKCEAQELKISLRVHTYHSALFHVHLELEFPLKVSSAGFKQALLAYAFHNQIKRHRLISDFSKNHYP